MSKPNKSNLSKDQNDILKKYTDLARKQGQFPSLVDLEQNDITKSKVRHHFGNLHSLKETFKEQKPKEYEECSKKEQTSVAKVALLKKHAEVVKASGRFLAQTELTQEHGITESQVRHHFGSLSRLVEDTKVAFPEIFEDLVTEALFTPERFLELKELVSDYDRFVITTVLAGCKVDRKFFKSLKQYCEEKNALLLLLPVSDPASNRSKLSQHMMFDPILKDEHFVYDDLALNTNFYISGLKLQAKQINPFTGLKRIGQRTGSFCYGSPKQTLEPIPNSKFPKVMMSPGALTLPDYTTHRYISNRTAYIAHHDHLMGALVVEIEDSKLYYTAQLQADNKGRFIDYGVMYDGSKQESVGLAGFVMGDLHVDDHDEQALNCWKKVMTDLPPEYLLIHDGLNGHSVNHHERKKGISQALSFDGNRLSLDRELKRYSEVMNDLATYARKKVKVVKSNHDEFIDRWLEDGLHVKEPQNALIGHKLWIAKYEGKDPLETGAILYGLKKEKFDFLQRDESFKIGGVELGFHGDQGANGSKGGLQSHENSHGNSVTGHTHEERILRGAWVVGTTSKLRVGYNKGASSWTQTSCLVYANGMRQLITSIKGKCRLD